jgi:glycosyltransferase involved in cell wall biosynthesis
MTRVSAVILTKESEERIGSLIDSLSWCSEIILVDDCSKDNTIKIAKSRGARVFKRRLDRDFAAQRNFGLQKANFDWVLFLDSDEHLSPALTKEIVRRLKFAKKKDVVGFCFKRKDFFINQWLNYGETAGVKLLRLGKKNAGSWKGKVHETWEIKGKILEMKNPILHYPHKNLTTVLEKINFYTSIRAQELYQKGVKTNVFQLVIYPWLKFLKDYFWLQGFRDGTAGMVFSLIMSLHSFLVRAKLYLLWQRK